jgi:hypothetical protein
LIYPCISCILGLRSSSLVLRLPHTDGSTCVHRFPQNESQVNSYCQGERGERRCAWSFSEHPDCKLSRLLSFTSVLTHPQTTTNSHAAPPSRSSFAILNSDKLSNIQPPKRKDKVGCTIVVVLWLSSALLLTCLFAERA